MLSAITQPILYDYRHLFLCQKPSSLFYNVSGQSGQELREKVFSYPKLSSDEF
jgi:hypothetical protein